MKINKMTSQGVARPLEQETAARAERPERSFSQDLTFSQEGQYRERMEALLRQISEQGGKLGKVPTYPELKRYKELVKNFIGEAVGRMYELNSQNGWDRQGRQKAYTIVRQVDSLLAGLTEDVRQGQEKQLAILEKQDAIRGLLVDLYL